MARLNTRTLNSHSRPVTDPGRFAPASEVAAGMQQQIRGVVRQAERAAEQRRQAIDTITDAPLRDRLIG